MCARSFVSVLRLTPIAMRGSRTVGSRGRFFGGPTRSAVSQIHVMLVNASKWVLRPLYLLITVYRNNSGTYQSRSVDRLPDLLV
jgi:hypothetical protein